MANSMHFFGVGTKVTTTSGVSTFSSAANVLRYRRKKDKQHPIGEDNRTYSNVQFELTEQRLHGSYLAQHAMRAINGSSEDIQHHKTPLDTVTKNAPPHVAVRYGDTIRLYAKSKYANGSTETGGYVGTFEVEKRFLASKNSQKQGELACIPPILPSGAQMYQPSSFRIISLLGLNIGTPVSYGDKLLLVDDDGRVWNNKIGVGPTTKNGYFGPRDPNIPGEMHISFYQLHDDDDSSSSESSDDEDGFVFFSNLAKTTKTMAETTFGKPTQADLQLAAAAMKSMGKVVYYGDRNVIIDIADSNRIRSKFNRVITHFRKNDESVVQGGYLRCDGRGKAILFEMHGPTLPSISFVDLTQTIAEAHDVHANETAESIPRRRLPSTTKSSITFGQPFNVEGMRRSSILTVTFSDNGFVKIPCHRIMNAEGVPIYRLVLEGKRPMRVLVQAQRCQRQKRTKRLRETLRGTYKEIMTLSGIVVVAYSCAAIVFTRYFGSAVLLPAIYVGVVAGVLVFSVEFFCPGTVVASRRLNTSLDSIHATGDWQVTIVSLEASATERVQGSSMSTHRSKKPTTELPLSIPKSFLIAENGNVAKATERYEATLAWRKEVNADAILAIPQTHYYTIKTYYKQYLHKQDKFGHPVYFEKIGSINMKQLQKEGISQDDLFRHYLFSMEFTLKYAASAICSCDACASSDTQKLCIVLDARGIGMRDMGGEAFEFIRRCTGIMQRHYPQRSYKIFFVNVPSWFGMVWKGIKPLLNEATRAKTNIITENDTAAALLEVIDPENLPVEYGGKCACLGGCDANSSYQQIQKGLVDSVLQCKPFDLEEFVNNADSRSDLSSNISIEGLPSVKNGQISREGSYDHTNGDADDFNKFYLDQDSDTLARSIPVGSFRGEALKVGFLLKRSMRIKHFNPIWNRRFFILHPDSLRFGKDVDSEIFQIVSFTSDTIVRKTQKQNNSFELITPLMASNGHSLLLFASTPQMLNEWVDALTDAIAKLQPTRDVMSMRMNKSNQDAWELEPAEAEKLPIVLAEKEELNQYWYSADTVEALAREVIAETPDCGRIAFLSTPSVYFATKLKQIGQQLECVLFDFDAKFASEGDNFVAFDFNKPQEIPTELHHTFDFVVIDPPFITKEVWEKYATATKLLLRSLQHGKILLSTIEENAGLMESLLSCHAQQFKPSIPHLVYQYVLYANYASTQLCSSNPELEDTE